VPRTALQAVWIPLLLAGSAFAQETRTTAPTVFEVPIAGGLEPALAVIDDRLAPDRARFLLEVIRRVHEAPSTVNYSQRERLVKTLLAHLDRSAGLGVSNQGAAAGGPRAAARGQDASGPAAATTTLPLPLAPEIWVDVIFKGRATPATLVNEILRSRPAALLYTALISLDDETRAWLSGERDLLAEIVARHPGAFMAAVPALRLRAARLQLPGGDAAAPVWEALAGRRLSEPAAFLREFLAHDGGRIAYFASALARLADARVSFALQLDSPQVPARIEAGRRLYALFARNTATWALEERPFWRPPFDPAQLLGELPADRSGRPVLIGTRRFWEAALAEGDDLPSARDVDPRALSEGPPADFTWLAERIFRGGTLLHRRPYDIVLFVSRNVAGVTPANARDALVAARAVAGYPALAAILERAGLQDVGAYAAVAGRAAQIAGLGDSPRASRVLAQFQGALALLARAAIRGTFSPAELRTHLSALAAVELSRAGEYDGRLVRWLGDVVRQAGSDGGDDDLDALALSLLAGRSPANPRFVDWEGSRYRIDPAYAERVRLAGLIGEQGRPYLSAARTLVTLADALSEPGLTRAALERHQDTLKGLAETLNLSTDRWLEGEATTRLAAALAAMQRAAQSGRTDEGARVAPELLGAADDVLARGLMQLAYAVALGHRERAVISAGDAASRHDFGLETVGFGPRGAWRLPSAGADRSHDWHATGSLLGLDLRLAEFALVPLSSRPPASRPTVNDGDRRVFVETALLAQPQMYTDGDRDVIVAAFQKAREALRAIRTAADAAALLKDRSLGPARRTLLTWVASHDRDRLESFLSYSDLLRFGLDDDTPRPGLNNWGTSAEPRNGCLCLQLADHSVSESLAGRPESGALATSFPDLNLRLAELLHELRMPASLLAPVLASATLDFITNARSRGHDDRRGLLEFVQGLAPDRVEQYLALLTTDGPLVPVDTGSEPRATDHP
jgi:hypothetical protein